MDIDIGDLAAAETLWSQNPCHRRVRQCHPIMFRADVHQMDHDDSPANFLRRSISASSSGTYSRENQNSAWHVGGTVSISPENPVQINDLNATILHCMGIDHERFVVPFQGLEQRLTGVEHQQVIRDVLA